MKKFAIGNVPQKLEQLLLSLKLDAIQVSDSLEIFGCLSLFNHRQTDAVIMTNPAEINRLVHLDQKTDLFFVGFDRDANPASKGIFPARKHTGSNHFVVSHPVVLVVRSIVLAETIQSHLSNP